MIFRHRYLWANNARIHAVEATLKILATLISHKLFTKTSKIGKYDY
jgi:hypothetical protein